MTPQVRAQSAQRLAAAPALSAFVSANAGSGKTRVLVDRVLRLLLGGVPPAKILCLTYTKAAAAEMALRVFERLSQWTGMDDGKLEASLTELEGHAVDRGALVRARRLFAHAVETPGGLKIETIHAFCERVLHLFPFEANVPARFEVLDDAAAAELLAEARNAVLTEAAGGSDARLQEALTTVSLEAAGPVLDDAIREAVRERAFLRGHRTRAALDAAMARLARALGLAEHETVDALEREMLEGGLDPHEWRSIADRLEAGRETDRGRAKALVEACKAATEAERLRSYLEVFFTRQHAPRADGSLVTKSVAASLAERMRRERDRLDRLAEKRRAAAVVVRTQALLTIAAAIFARKEAMKGARGALDFDDLIDKALRLLGRAGASWVLYKLDAGVDHVLVDEAQDTNPAQWEILKAVTADFSAGAGARGDLRRTIFAVGDVKQSIFGFQGADPRALTETGRHFRRAVEGAGERFEDVELRVSFRSSPAVLSAVDAVFMRPESFKGLAFGGDRGVIGTVHESSRPRDHGRVEIWPLVRPSPVPDPDAWKLPVDEPDASAPPVVLAGRIARAVRRWTSIGDDQGHVSAPGDVLILVRKRGALFEAIIRALKRARVPVAGADRLRLGEHIAVLDLVVAGRAALLPDDDLNLATALKAPFVGLCDEDLVRIGARRREGQSLVSALREASAADESARTAVAQLDSWRALAEGEGPFSFYATLLGPLGARRALASRLGPEAGDAIDEFLALALAHERREAPSLAAFLASFGDTSHEIKRDMDVARGEVRVMTVHGAKGLEAETVVIADACRVDDPRPVLVPVDAGRGVSAVPAWMPRRDKQPELLRAIRDGQRIREREEHNRLLYVAMTRAKDRLVIAPYVGRTPATPPAECWFAMLEAGLTGAPEGLAEAPFPHGESDERQRMGVWQGGTPRPSPRPQAAEQAAAEGPAWLFEKVAHEPESGPPLRPSSAVAATATPHGGGRSARAESRLVGTLAHALIEHLPAVPAADRSAAAARFVAAHSRRLGGTLADRIVRDALAVIEHPGLAPLFGSASRAEVPVAGTLHLAEGGAPLPVLGQIDRLAVTDDAVIIVDFKTTERPPAGIDQVAVTHVAQLSIYAALIDDIFPGKRVRAFLVYTADGSVIEVPGARLSAALACLAARA